LQVSAGTEVSAPDRQYAGAVAAIGRRDYASALEFLQLARTRAPNDVRVLNAFGVVYDKLGRFDLSARYYAQADALQPASPIVAANVAYSAVLERRVAQPVEGAFLAQSAGEVKSGASLTTTAGGPPVVRWPIEPARAQFTTSPLRLPALRTNADPRSSDPAAWATAPIIASSPFDAAPIYPRVAAASPKPMKPPPLGRPSATDVSAAKLVRAPISKVATSPPQPTALRQSLYRAETFAANVHAADPPLRIDAAGQLVAPSRAMAVPILATSAPLPAVAAPPIRLAHIAPPQPKQRPSVVLLAAQPSSKVLVRLASRSAAPGRPPLLTGAALLVINASGRQAGGQPVVTRLAHLGWSVPRSTQAEQTQAQTSIVYPARNAAVAYALARTLPYKVRLVNCASRCDRIRLVVGADALAWRKGLSAGSSLRARTA
jgi:hypothetical protein